MEFVGKYKLEKDENFEEFLKILSVPYLIRKAVVMLSPTMVIEYDKETETFTISCKIYFNYEIKFKLNEEFDETLATGEVVKMIITRRDNELYQKQVTGKTAGVEYIREVDGDNLNITCSYNGVVARRFFKRI